MPYFRERTKRIAGRAVAGGWVAGMLLVGTLAAAEPAGTAPPAPTEHAGFGLDRRPENRAMNKALDRILDGDWGDVTLSQLPGRLEKALGVPVVLERKALKEMDLREDSPISFAGKGQTAAAALRRTLREVGLTALPVDGVLVITGEGSGCVRTHFRRCLYDVRDLIVRTETDGSRRLDPEPLVQLIVSQCGDRNDWADMGGEQEMAYFEADGLDCLAVLAPYDVLRDVETLLADLRAVRQATPPFVGPPPRRVRPSPDAGMHMQHIPESADRRSLQPAPTPYPANVPEVLTPAKVPPAAQPPSPPGPQPPSGRTALLDADGERAVRSINAFGLKLRRTSAREHETGNTETNRLFSPFVAATLLATTVPALDGPAARRVAAVLHPEQSPSGFLLGLRQVVRSLPHDAGFRGGGFCDVPFAGRLRPGPATTVSADYAETLRDRLGFETAGQAPLPPVPVAVPVPVESLTIAKWGTGPVRTAVPEDPWPLAATRGAIATDEAAAPEPPTPAALRATAAIALDARWFQRFTASETRLRPFRGASGERLVPTMRCVGRFGRARTPEAEWLCLRLFSAEFWLILPAAGPTGFARAVESLDDATIRAVAAAAKAVEVDLTLPKFALESHEELAPLMDRLGLEVLFDPAAPPPLWGIEGSVPPVFRGFRHLARLEIHELGTRPTDTAADSESFVPPPEPVGAFAVDRPFLFVLRDERTGLLLLVGEVRQP